MHGGIRRASITVRKPSFGHGTAYRGLTLKVAGSLPLKEFL